jgi:hypothetical protein
MQERRWQLLLARLPFSKRDLWSAIIAYGVPAKKLTDPFGVHRPEFNHVNNVTQTHHNLSILKSDGVFADHSTRR